MTNEEFIQRLITAAVGGLSYLHEDDEYIAKRAIAIAEKVIQQLNKGE